MFMSLLYVGTKRGVARASPSRRAAQSVLLGASAVGATACRRFVGGGIGDAGYRIVAATVR